MLILGETLLKGSMSAPVSVFYYTLCMCLTAAAFVIALADARASARRTLQERRDLINSTLENLQREVRAGPHRDKGDNSGNGIGSKPL
jgi:hypothetical protein